MVLLSPLSPCVTVSISFCGFLQIEFRNLHLLDTDSNDNFSSFKFQVMIHYAEVLRQNKNYFVKTLSFVRMTYI